MAAGCVLVRSALYVVFLLSYMCPLRPNDSLQLLKHEGLKSSTFCAINHGFRGSVAVLLRNRVNFDCHLGFLAHRRRTFLTSRLAYYPNSVVGFRLLRLLSCGDISPIPGPAICNKNLCSVCRRSVAHNHRAIQCDLCLCWCHIKCGKVTPTEYTKLASSTTSFLWNCPACITTVPDPVTNILNESSDNINIVHVHPSPPPNSSLPSCQLPTSSGHIKDNSSLKGMIVNCNGLKSPSRFSEFQVLLDFHKPDIIFGCESKLDCEVPTYSVFPPTYSVLRKDRNRNGGGVFLAIKSEIVSEEKPTFGKDCEIIWSSVKIGNYKTLHLASCYRPPNSPHDALEQFSDSINCVFESSNHHPNIIVAGDFNLGDIEWSADVPIAINQATLTQHNRLL